MYHNSELKKQILESILGSSYDAYVNFQRNVNLPRKKQHRRRVPLWQFLLRLLHFDQYNKYIEWSSTQQLEFRIRDPSGVAALWGSIKDKCDMTYEKFGRALRYYYGKSIIEKVNGKRYFYKFIFSRKTKNYLNKFGRFPKPIGDKDALPTLNNIKDFISSVEEPCDSSLSPCSTTSPLSSSHSNDKVDKSCFDDHRYKESNVDSDGENDLSSNTDSYRSDKECHDTSCLSPASSSSDDTSGSEEFQHPLPVTFMDDTDSGMKDLFWHDWNMFTQSGVTFSEMESRPPLFNSIGARNESAFRPLSRQSPIPFDDGSCLCHDHAFECCQYVDTSIGLQRSCDCCLN